jgi:uncharacterized membrane protein YfcA
MGRKFMLLEIRHFLIICPLAFVAGIIDAIAGGGGLITLPAYMLAGLPPHFAIGTNKLGAGLGTAVALGRYMKDGYVKKKQACVCIVCALAGSAAGAGLGFLVKDEIFEVIMVLVLPVVAFYVLKEKNLDKEREAYTMKRTICLCIPVAFGVGVYDGFYGAGTGTFFLLLLTGVVHMKLREANGMAKVSNLATNIAAFSVYLINGRVLWTLGLAAGVFGIAGNYIGATAFEKGGSRIVKPVMLIVLTAFFLKVFSSLL